jgi:hypothetical protein
MGPAGPAQRHQLPTILEATQGARDRGPALPHCVPPGRDHFPNPTRDSGGRREKHAPNAFIPGYFPVVPTALALSVRGNLRHSKLLVQLTRFSTPTTRDSNLWVIDSAQRGQRYGIHIRGNRSKP